MNDDIMTGNLISRQGICRCCLSASGTWDLSAVYITEQGSKEVFADLLKQCFGITLSHLNDLGCSQQICESCILHLRDANNFHEQVLKAEQNFNCYWDTKNNIGNLISRQGICRCCLSASGTWDLSAVYITEQGSKEVFADLLKQCFGITLSHLNDLGCSQQICESCILHLRDANNFHEQVLKAEQNFNCYWDTKNNIEGKSSILPNIRRQKCLTKGAIDDTDDDSDIPISLYKAQIKCNKNNSQELEKKDIKLSTDNTNSKIKLIKQVSERKRISLTCSIILKNTTACPFRHHKSWFQCFYCSEDFMAIDLLRNHTLQSHADIDEELKKIKHYPRSLQIDITNLECRQCRLHLTDVDALKRHFVEEHDKLIYNECVADYKINSSPYSCHICKQEFHVFRTLTTHLNEHYANCICDVCGKSFLNSKRLKVHKRTHENGTYPCKECGKILKTKTAKANHIESAHSKRIIKCQICYKPMKHYNDRIKHMSEIHNITHKFQCYICGREYNIKHYLATHIRQTHGHKNKKCVECGMAFINNHGLKKHMLMHSRERPYKCTVCAKSYARSYTLKEHMRVHEEERHG